MSTQIVMFDSPEAAEHRTDVIGWVSRDGTFYGDGPSNERTARYAGCTHVPCERCGEPTPKRWLHCDSCRAAKDAERYAAMPRESWDGVSMLYSEVRDTYYRGIDEAEEGLEEGQSLADLRLVICSPNYVPQIDPDYCCDQLAEDDDVPPDAVCKAMDAFNEAVAGIVLSWSPSKVALALDAREQPSEQEG